MGEWFIFALLAFLLWGLWGFFPKISTKYIDPKSALIFEVVGAIIVGMVVLFLVGFKPQTQINGVTFAILTGVAGLLGALFFLYAMTKGNVAAVVATTALYPVVTIILAFFILHEPITIKQGIGMLFAMVAILLISL